MNIKLKSETKIYLNTVVVDSSGLAWPGTIHQSIASCLRAHTDYQSIATDTGTQQRAPRQLMLLGHEKNKAGKYSMKHQQKYHFTAALWQE
jgi:G3E family GTPase